MFQYCLCLLGFTIFSVIGGSDVVPQFQVVKVGDPINIRCNSETVPRWHKFGIPVENTHNGEVIITSAIEDDTGTYTCKGRKTNKGTAEYFNSQADVMVAVPDNSRIVTSYKSVDEGSMASFTCNSHGRPKWFFQNTATFPIDYTNTLSLYSVDKGDEGKYYCFGNYEDDRKGYFIAEAVLEINARPQSIDSGDYPHEDQLQGDPFEDLRKSGDPFEDLGKSDTSDFYRNRNIYDSSFNSETSGQNQNSIDRAQEFGPRSREMEEQFYDFDNENSKRQGSYHVPEKDTTDKYNHYRDSPGSGPYANAEVFQDFDDSSLDDSFSWQSNSDSADVGSDMDDSFGLSSDNYRYNDKYSMTDRNDYYAPSGSNRDYEQPRGNALSRGLNFASKALDHYNEISSDVKHFGKALKQTSKSAAQAMGSAYRKFKDQVATSKSPRSRNFGSPEGGRLSSTEESLTGIKSSFGRSPSRRHKFSRRSQSRSRSSIGRSRSRSQSLTKVSSRGSQTSFRKSPSVGRSFTRRSGSKSRSSSSRSQSQSPSLTKISPSGSKTSFGRSSNHGRSFTRRSSSKSRSSSSRSLSQSPSLSQSSRRSISGRSRSRSPSSRKSQKYNSKTIRSSRSRSPKYSSYKSQSRSKNNMYSPISSSSDSADSTGSRVGNFARKVISGSKKLFSKGSSSRGSTSQSDRKKSFFGGFRKQDKSSRSSGTSYRRFGYQKGNSTGEQCPNITVLNGEVKKNGFVQGSHARYVCEKGFTLIGSPIRKCLSNFTWSGKDSKCEASKSSSKVTRPTTNVIYFAIIMFSLYVNLHIK